MSVNTPTITTVIAALPTQLSIIPVQMEEQPTFIIKSIKGMTIPIARRQLLRHWAHAATLVLLDSTSLS